MVRLLLLAPVAALLVLFALSNPQPVEIRIWPFDLAWSTSVALAVLLPCAAAFLFGALVVWSATLPDWVRARRAEAQAGRLTRELRRRQAAAQLAGPGA
jgi:uncharacterized integral membrane protein